LAAYSIHRLIERRTAPWLRQFLIAASDTGANLVAQGIGKFRAAR
jgi:hypothetical protein